MIRHGSDTMGVIWVQYPGNDLFVANSSAFMSQLTISDSKQEVDGDDKTGR